MKELTHTNYDKKIRILSIYEIEKYESIQMKYKKYKKTIHYSSGEKY